MSGSDWDATGRSLPLTNHNRQERPMFWNKKQTPPPGKTITVQQGVAANALSIQALINVLVNKKICTRDEIMDELKKITKPIQNDGTKG
jgi:hypothetical protein